jgi:hypothetical protein
LQKHAEEPEQLQKIRTSRAAEKSANQNKRLKHSDKAGQQKLPQQQQQKQLKQLEQLHQFLKEPIRITTSTSKSTKQLQQCR